MMPIFRSTTAREPASGSSAAVPGGPATPERSLEVCVVAHTHWDREWYYPAGRFRQGLVALIDALLASPSDAAAPFLLDGQAVVLEDYLAVRSERAAELQARLAAGSLEAGPWYVLADNLIPSGEAIVRNLLVGRRVLRRLGATAPAVAWCPDTFGHPAALPAIAAGFGYPVAIVWRGVGGARAPVVDTMRWRAAGGEQVVLYHLPPDGYETGSALPVTPAKAGERWSVLRALLHARSNVGVALLPNGADHHARQAGLPDGVAMLARAAAPDAVVRDSLAGFSRRLLAAVGDARVALPVIEGELRDSYGYTWTLAGTLATRAVQKRANARAERALLRDVEPWLALAWLHGEATAHGVSSEGRVTLAQAPALLDAAWRTLLRAHPHDTLCGCSIDDVALAMDARLRSAMAQADGLREAALAMAMQHDPVAARSAPLAEAATVVIRNRCARWRGGVAEVTIDTTLADEPVGPGSAGAMPTFDKPAAARSALFGVLMQPGPSRVVHRRRESPQHYPDNDLVRAHKALAWVPPVPPLGLELHATVNALDAVHVQVTAANGAGELAATTAASTWSDAPRFPVALRALAEEIELDNGRVRVVAGRTGITMVCGTRTLTHVLALETSRDEGDAYTPAIRAPSEPLALRTIRAGAAGPLRASVVLAWSTAGRRNKVRVRTTLILDADADAVRIDIRGDNRRRNHRLRLRFETDVAGRVPDAGTRDTSNFAVHADAAFGPVLRRPLIVPALEQAREYVVPTMPMHRWVTITNGAIGATLHADGLAEVEALPNGHIALTLLRCIGELSKASLPERPGHAGWPAAIPRAQSLGAFHARAALHLHGAWSPATLQEIEAASDALLLPLTGVTYRDLVAAAAVVPGPALEGLALRFSAATLADDGDGIVLRCVNDSAETQPGAWIMPADGPWDVARARLDEQTLEPWRSEGRRIAVTVPPRAIETIRVRRPVR